jgi:hypothetical protein
MNEVIHHLGVRVSYPVGFSKARAIELCEEERKDWWDNLNHKALGSMEIVIDEEGIALHSQEAEKIVRLRRITGYLSQIKNFNDAKQSELADRKKHC